MCVRVLISNNVLNGSGSCSAPPSSHVIFVVIGHVPGVCRKEDVVLTRAVAVAHARLDEHHLTAEGVALGAAELHLGGGGGVRRAAAPVRARAAELGPIGADTPTARELETHSTGASWGPDTFLPLLWRQTEAHVHRVSQCFLNIQYSRTTHQQSDILSP